MLMFKCGGCVTWAGAGTTGNKLKSGALTGGPSRGQGFPLKGFPN